MNAELLITLAHFVTGGFLVFLAITVTRDNFMSTLNRVTGAMLLFAGLGPLMLAMGAILGQPQPGAVPLRESPWFGLYHLWEFFFPSLLLFSWYFPVQRAPRFRVPRLHLLVFLPQIFNLILAVVFFDIGGMYQAAQAAQQQGGFLGLLVQPLAYVGARLLLLIGYLRAYEEVIFGTVNVIYALAALYFFESGRRTVSSPRLRSQARQVAWGLRLGLGLWLLSLPTAALLPGDSGPRAAVLLHMLAALTGGVFLTNAIIRYQFLDVRLIFRQSLVFTVTSALLVGAYVIAAVQAEHLLTPWFGQRAQLVSYILIVMLLLLYQPLSSGLENIIRSMFIRTRTDARYVVERFSRQIVSVLEPEQLRHSIEETLKTALLIEQVFFVMFDDTVREYVLLESTDNTRRMIIDRDDLMLRGINLLDAPTPITSLYEYEEGSPLAARLHELGVRVILPLKDARYLLGFVALSGKTAGYRFTPEDYNLLGILSNQMVTALVNARLYSESLERLRLQEELSMARQIQLDLLPSRPPDIPCARIHAVSHPSRTVGGDFYDFLTIDGGRRLGIVIADASGKGMPAALLIAQIQAIIRSEVHNGNPIPVIMHNMNAQVLQSTSSEKYVTLFYGELDVASGRLEYANAGHNHPVLVRADGRLELLETGGPIIGALPDVEYKAATVQLDREDLLLLFTDGLSETRNAADEEYGEERIRRFVQACRRKEPEELIRELLQDVRRFDPSDPPQDDTTLIALKVVNGFQRHA